MAEDVGKLPDNSVAEALARVTGIQIRRDAGEANSVLIRGLPNVVTLLNGREVFTTIDRFIALGDVPANLLQQVDVYKSNGATQVEGGIAGTIDVHTRRAFDNPGTHVYANARAPYNDKADTFNPNLGLTVSKTWGETFGALAGFSFIGNKYHEERAFNIEFVDQSGVGGAFGAGNPPPVRPLLAPFVMGYIPIGGDRERAAGNFALQWRPDDRHRAVRRGLRHALPRRVRARLLRRPAPAGQRHGRRRPLNPGTNILHTLQNNNVFTITSTQANDNTSLTQQYAVGGSRQLGELRLSTDLAFTKSKFELINPILDLGIVVPQVAVSTNADGTAQLDYGGPASTSPRTRASAWSNWFDNHRTDNGSSVDWRADAEWADPASKHVDKLAFGLRVSDRRRRLDRRHPRWHRRPARSTRLASEFPGLGCVSEPMASGRPRLHHDPLVHPLPRLPPRQHRHHPPGLHGHDRAEAPRSRHVLRHVGEDVRGLWAGQPEGPAGVDRRWSAVLGLRVVRTDENLDGNLSQDTNNDGRLDYPPGRRSTRPRPTSSPRVNTKLSLTERVVGRLQLQPDADAARLRRPQPGRLPVDGRQQHDRADGNRRQPVPRSPSSRTTSTCRPSGTSRRTAS